MAVGIISTLIYSKDLPTQKGVVISLVQREKSVSPMNPYSTIEKI